jgi:DNA-binding NarL/FixJ family response regulator
MSQKLVSTVIIDPQQLIRAFWSSLLLAHTYKIVGSCDAIRALHKIQCSDAGFDLIILSGQNVDQALNSVNVLSTTHRRSKVVFLFDEMNSEDINKLSNSQLDGCVSLHVSHDVLLHSLNSIVHDDFRIIALGDGAARVKSPFERSVRALSARKNDGSEKSDLNKGSHCSRAIDNISSWS